MINNKTCRYVVDVQVYVVDVDILLIYNIYICSKTYCRCITVTMAIFIEDIYNIYVVDILL